MPLLDSNTYDDSYQRVIAKSTKLCKITGVRSIVGKQRDDGKPSRDVDFVQLSLLEPAVSTDKEDLHPGFFQEIGFGSYAQTNGEEGLETTNRISKERIRELVVCALDLPANVKSASAELQKQGGMSALLNKEVGVEWSARGTNQNVDRFLPASLLKKPAAS